MNCTAYTSALHQTHTSVSTSELPCIRENISWCCISRRKKLSIFAQNVQLFYCIITPPEGAVRLIYFHCSVPMSACDVWRQNKLCKCVCISNGTVFSPSSLSVPDLTPNIGLFWYFFAEMFEHFRLFFLCVFQINVFFYTIPLSIKLK